MTKATNTKYSFEFKLDLVQRHLAGEGSISSLAALAGLSSTKLLENWVRIHRREEPDRLRPKPQGRSVRLICFVRRMSVCSRRWRSWENCRP